MISCVMRIRIVPLLASIYLVIFTNILPADEPPSILQIRHFREKEFNISEGWIDAEGWVDQARVALLDFEHYRDWAVRWMDGKDPESAKFWVQLTDYRFKTPDILDVMYDLNIGWPLNSKGELARFRIDQTALGQSIVRLRLESPIIGLAEAYLVMWSEQNRVYFRFELRFWGIIEGLMNYDKYHQALAWRLNHLAGNLRDYLAAAAPSSK